MSKKNNGIIVEPLHLALTRPAMVLGVTYSAFLLNVLITMQIFILKKNLFYLPLCIPVHLVFYSMCQNDPRVFDLFFLWFRTKAANMIFGTALFWKSSSYGANKVTIGERTKSRKK